MEDKKETHKKIGLCGFVVAVAVFACLLFFESNLATSVSGAIFSEIFLRDVIISATTILSITGYVICILNYHKTLKCRIQILKYTSSPLICFILFVTAVFGIFILSRAIEVDWSSPYALIWLFLSYIFCIVIRISDYNAIYCRFQKYGRQSMRYFDYILCMSSAVITVLGILCTIFIQKTSNICWSMLYASSFTIPLLIFNVELLYLSKSRYFRQHTAYVGLIILFCCIFLFAPLLQLLAFLISGNEYALKIESKGYHYDAGVVLWENRYLLAAWVVEALAFIFALIPWAIKKK